MAAGVSIDFSALKKPDYVGSYVNAFRKGQELARGAAPMAATPSNALTGAPVSTDQTLRARIAGMSAAERARAGEQADLMAGLGQGLKSIAYAERPAVLTHLTPALAARGVPPSVIAAFDPTDENLDAVVASARSVGAMLGPTGPVT